MPGVAVGERPGSWLEDAVKDGDKLPGINLRQNAVVHRAQHALGLCWVFHSIGADQYPTEGHEQRRSHPLVDDVCHDQAKLPVWQRDQIVKVARSLPGWLQGRCHLPACGRRQLAGQKAGLHFARQRQFLLHLAVGLSELLLQPAQREMDLRTGQDLFELERLGDIVHTPYGESLDLVLDLVQRADKDDWDIPCQWV